MSARKSSAFTAWNRRRIKNDRRRRKDMKNMPIDLRQPVARGFDSSTYRDVETVSRSSLLPGGTIVPGFAGKLPVFYLVGNTLGPLGKRTLLDIVVRGCFYC